MPPVRGGREPDASSTASVRQPSAKVNDPLGSFAFSFNGDKPLYPLAVKNFAGIEIAFGIGGDHVKSEKLAAILAHAAQLADHLAVFRGSGTRRGC